MNIISMTGVIKKFKEKTAISGLSFNVKEGEIFGFLGPSGSGKTTTIKLLTSQLLQTSGSINVFGEDPYKNKKDIYKSIGILSDNSGIYSRLSVKDNLMLYARINDVTEKEVIEVLGKIGMGDSIKTEAKKLSRGMKQRLMLAIALLHKPKLLFLDEPTSALDPGNTLEIHKLLKELNREGTTIFLTTHNMDEADRLCDRVAFLNDGKIVDLGRPIDLKLKYTNNNIKVILKDGNKGVIVKNDLEGSNNIKKWMDNGELIGIHSMEPTLEEVFLKLTGREL